jgi:hypothetical protein
VADTLKITVEVPANLLERARAASGDNLTATVRQGLRLVAAGQAYRNLRARRGKLRGWPSLSRLKQDRG